MIKNEILLVGGAGGINTCIEAVRALECLESSVELIVVDDNSKKTESSNINFEVLAQKITIMPELPGNVQRRYRRQQERKFNK